MTYNLLFRTTPLILLIFIGCSYNNESKFFNTANRLLWTNPDSCIAYIEEHKENMSTKEAIRAELIRQHGIYKTSQDYNNDSLLQNMAEEFCKRLDYRSAGEAKYILGANQVQKGHHFEATIALKEAENFFSASKDVQPILLGMMYLNLGIASERSRFFNVAKEY